MLYKISNIVYHKAINIRRIFIMYNNSCEILNDNWLIAHDKDNVGKTEKWFETGLPENKSKMGKLPAFGHMYFPDCYGVFWFQKKFTPKYNVTENEIYQLCIGAADFLCETYINGKFVGVYRDTETPFNYNVTEFINPNSENILTFRVSKPYTEDIDGYRFGEVPHRNQRPTDIWPGMCFNCTGIAGNVELKVLPKVYISDMYINGNVETSCVDVVYTIFSEYENSVSCQLTTQIGNKRTGERETENKISCTVNKGENTFSVSVPVADVKLWSNADPFLYFVNAYLNLNDEPIHCLFRHCGFRTFRVNDEGFFELNGKRVFLRCSHTGNSYPFSTFAIPHDPDLVRRDLLMAKASGLNMVRFISGVALPDQLDYADELGIMIYEEPLTSWLTENGDKSKEIYQFGVSEMVKRDRSHPSVCIWGMLNETVPNPPFDDCCNWGRESLPLLRQYDQTRLVLYSSGRFDGDAFTGSVANPYHDKWQCLWNREDENSKTHAVWKNTNPGAFFENVGDIHAYPKYPISDYDKNLLRTVGCDVKRPVFLSESGCGSLFDVIWLTKKFEQLGVDKALPDVARIYSMQDLFLTDLKKYGFDEEYAFPGDILKESQRLSARHRALHFDIVRSNPYMCGYSITGLLDHSICGEGLWTYMREWKPGVTDAMQNGLAPLKWCIFPSTTHVYSGEKFGINVVLANEDVLTEKDYPVSLRIFGGNGIIYRHSEILHPTKENLKGFSLPVFNIELSLDVPTGVYEIHCDMEGAAAADSAVKFFLTNKADIKPVSLKAAAWGLDEKSISFLKNNGVELTPLKDADVTTPCLVILGNGESSEKEEVFNKVYEMINNGSRVFVASRYALAQDDDWCKYLRLPENPDNYPHHTGKLDWLYHKEYLAKRNHPYFKNLPKGIMNWEYWIQLINGADFRYGSTPDDVASASFGPGNINEKGYEGGFNIGSYNIGKGALILNSYNLLENLTQNPAADMLLLNILSSESEKVSK